MSIRAPFCFYTYPQRSRGMKAVNTLNEAEMCYGKSQQAQERNNRPPVNDAHVKL